jgi:CRP/FNR family transcriptional regulator, cyclic AMP receptor protein
MPLVRVSDADPDLFSGIGDPNARAASVAEVTRYEKGSWRTALDDIDPRGHFGLLVIEGILIRRVRFGRRPVLELVGPGDVLRPWVGLGPDSSLQQPSHWRVHERADLALLDRRFAQRVSQWPEVAAALMDRYVHRARLLTLHLSIAQLPRLREGLTALFWYLADRWGRMTSDGIVIDVPLTHELLAGLVGARRPAVTTTLGELQRSGEISRRDDGRWVVHGEPPAELNEPQLVTASS